MIFLFSFASSCQVLIYMLVVFETKKEFAGTAMAFANTIVYTSGVFLVPMIGVLLEYTNNDYQTTFLIVPASFVLAIACIFVLKFKSGLQYKAA